jgi:hypothetical protein
MTERIRNTGMMSVVTARLRAVVAAMISLMLSAFAAPVLAHDFWLSAERENSATPPVLRLWVGHHLSAEESRPYTAASTYRFRLFSALGVLDLAPLAREGADPFLTLPPALAAAGLFALDRHAVDIALEGPQFDSYLAEEHLQDILTRRSDKAVEGRERYTRHIKVLVGDGGPQRLHARRTGQALEIILLDPPRDPGAERMLRAQVLFAGKPLPGRTLTVLHDADGRFDNDNARVSTVVTDAKGIASFAYDRPGFWMLRLVYMLPCREACGSADWRSYWAAYALQPDWLPRQP